MPEPATFTKPDLVGVLTTHANTLRLASVYRILAHGSDLASQFKTLVSAQHAAAFAPSLALLEDRQRLVHYVDQLDRTILRAAITEAYELTKSYCESTGQDREFRNQPWYPVFRHIRNCLNHNFRLRFRESESSLPAEWRGIEITRQHNGRELSHELLPPHAVLEWLEELEFFVSKVLR